jgi:hypothetical protein
MNKGLVVAVVAAAVILGGAYYMHRPRPEPVAEAPAAPPPSRIVPKKVEPPTPVATTPGETPRKAAPEKAETAAPATPAPAAAPTTASLTLDTDVPGASVFIDRQFVGNTPLSLDKLEPGTKRIQVTATGLDSVQKTVELSAGPNNISIRVKEVSLNAKVGVVHKHGMGSCDGSLIATLDGLRYDTSNKGDAFNLSFAQLETFTVDYIEKNLRVKQKGGKTWNFTLPDKTANADALFVFHRDVEAARKKLADGYARAQ